jgi:hypothetical protein
MVAVEMPARFRCDATFTIPVRRYFVLRGQIIYGIVHPGMRAIIPTPSGGELIRTIASIEVLSTGDKQGAVGLCLRCEDDSELTGLQRMGIHDVICSVTEE